MPQLSDDLDRRRPIDMGKKDGPPEAAKKKAAPALRSFASVFMHADATDVALMVLGLVGAMGDGLSTPVMLLITSRIFNDLGSGPDALQQFSSKINEVARKQNYDLHSTSSPSIASVDPIIANNQCRRRR